MRVYRRSRAWAFASFALTVVMVFFVKMNSCNSFILTWLGIGPANLIFTGVAIAGAYMSMPTSPTKKYEPLQVPALPFPFSNVAPTCQHVQVKSRLSRWA